MSDQATTAGVRTRQQPNRTTLSGWAVQRPASTLLFLLVLILLVALWMRVRDLGHIPLGAHYDEAASAIIADEIAHGARPIFIRAYTGEEVLFFYLAGIAISLIGHPLIALRLTATWVGIVSIAVSYRTARELFARERHGQWIAVVAAAIQATILWTVAINRLGFRAQVQPLLQALTILFIYRALRSEGRRAWANWALAGMWCGLAAYTYLAIRAFPILLATFLLWILIFEPGNAPAGSGAHQDAARSLSPTGRRGRLLRLRQFGLFLLVALLVFAPLGAFYVRNPEFFGTRMAQVSVFSAQVGGQDPWRAFWYAARTSFAMFTVRGDMNWRFNVAWAPALWPPLGLFFYIGLLIGLWRLFRTGEARRRGTYLLLLLWLPVMLLPSILGGGDVDLSLSLRAIGVMPALFYWPALGLVESMSALQRWTTTRPWLGRRLSSEAVQIAVVGLIVALLMATGIYTFYQCFYVWGPSLPNYYTSSGDLVDAASYLNAHLPADATCYVSAEHYRHPTMALLAQRYAELKWLVGPDVLVYPTAAQGETWYVLTHDAMPSEQALMRTLGSPAEEHLAPDGQPAFRLYRFAPGQVPVPQPQERGDANLGDMLRFLGYDLNASPVSAGTFDITMYFQVLARGEGGAGRDDYTFFVHLVDDLGFGWGDKTFFTYPSSQWSVGEVIAFHCVFPIWKGAPPARYRLDVGAFSPSLDARLPVLNQAGQMAGTTFQLGPFDVGRAPSSPAELPPIQQPLQASFDPQLDLIGLDRDRGDLRPGETLSLSLYWRSKAMIESGYIVSIWLEADGARTPLWDGDPVHGLYPFDRWQPPEFIRDRYALRLPTDITPGSWDLRLAVLRPDRTPAPTTDGRESVLLSRINVLAADRQWEPPAFAHPVGARLGDRVELLGYDLDREEVRPGESIHLTLVWRCLREMDTAYTVFTHVLDRAEQIRGQQDNPPVAGTYPTTLWVPGEVVVDRYDITIRGDTPPGMHVIEVGLYDPANMQRLPVLDPSGALGDRILLGQIEIRF